EDAVPLPDVYQVGLRGRIRADEDVPFADARNGRVIARRGRQGAAGETRQDAGGNRERVDPALVRRGRALENLQGRLDEHAVRLVIIVRAVEVILPEHDKPPNRG